MAKQKTTKQHPTSWEPVQKWYKNSVGDEGHYYHKQIIMPGILRLLALNETKKPSVLDLACGQGVLARQLPPTVAYTGIDVSVSLVKSAKQQESNPLHRFFVGDVTKTLPIKEKDFSHATIILALQNIEHPKLALQQAQLHLEAGGQLIIVLNHPCFRIPRQSSWQVDQEKKIQYRRIDRYATSMQIPIQAHPSKGQESPDTMSFHHPISSYIVWLKEAGFVTVHMEEWCSDKISTGSAAKMENRSREEFPLFLTIVARKESQLLPQRSQST